MDFHVELTNNGKWIVEENDFTNRPKSVWAFSYASDVADFLNEQKRKYDTQPKPHQIVKVNPDEPPF